MTTTTVEDILEPQGDGWRCRDGGYLCAGCAVRDGHMHRCHGHDGLRACTCEICSLVCDGCGAWTTGGSAAKDWFIDVPHWSDGIAAVACPKCREPR